MSYQECFTTVPYFFLARGSQKSVRQDCLIECPTKVPPQECLAKRSKSVMPGFGCSVANKFSRVDVLDHPICCPSCPGQKHWQFWGSGTEWCHTILVLQATGPSVRLRSTRMTPVRFGYVTTASFLGTGCGVGRWIMDQPASLRCLEQSRLVKEPFAHIFNTFFFLHFSSLPSSRNCKKTIKLLRCRERHNYHKRIGVMPNENLQKTTGTMCPFGGATKYGGWDRIEDKHFVMGYEAMSSKANVTYRRGHDAGPCQGPKLHHARMMWALCGLVRERFGLHWCVQARQGETQASHPNRPWDSLNDVAAWQNTLAH